LEAEPTTPSESPPVTRCFPTTQSCGGLVASVGVLFLTGLGVLATLPGFPTAGLFPTWLTWTLRLAPVPAVLLLWAVVSEAEYKVKTDGTAISFRQGLGRIARVPWREVHDFFADCGRGLREVAESGGSMRQRVGDEGQGTGEDVGAGAPTHDGKAEAPFTEYRPDYVLVSDRGEFVFDDVVARLATLIAEVVAHAPAEAPGRWEEASRLTCPACRRHFTVSAWPLTELTEPLEPFACPGCGESLGSLLAGVTQPFIIDLRGTERRRFGWHPPLPAAVEGRETPEAAEAPDDAGAEKPPDETP
jgi:hypothetical protein